MQKIEFSWSSPKNIPIYACEWQPSQPAKGVIVLVHGIGEHIGRYEHVARMFTDNQYAFIGSDLTGHGKSGGQRGHADSFEDFYSQITWMLQESEQRYPGLPVFLYGHSLGANLVLGYVEKGVHAVAGAIVTSPALAITRVPPIKLAVGKLMYALYPRFSMTNSLDTSGLSRDENVVAAYVNDPLVHPLVSARLGLDLINSSQWIRDQGLNINIPLLLLHGERMARRSAILSPVYCPLRTDVDPAGTLPVGDFNDTAGHDAHAADQVGGRDFGGPHGFAAGDDVDTVVERLRDAACRLGIDLQHVEPGTDGNNLDLGVVLAHVALERQRVVERNLPLLRVVFRDVKHELILRFVVARPLIGECVLRDTAEGQHRNQRE